MNDKEKGFTMVELLVTMAIFVIVVAAASEVFTGLLTQFKQQSKIAETDTAGIAGLEIMRRDIAQAGYGLPWVLNGATYRETTSESGSTPWTERDYNDGPDTNPQRGVCASSACSSQSSTCDPGYSPNNCVSPPAPFRSGNNVGISQPDGTATFTNSQADLLVIKSATVGINSASQKWTYVANSGALPDRLKLWNSAAEDPLTTDQVISIDPVNGTNQNVLQNNGGSFAITLGDGTFSWNESVPPALQYTANSYEPGANTFKQYIVYGIAPADGNASRIRMPFNRADYYVKRPATNMPSRCAVNTGILYKAVTNNTLYNDGTCAQAGSGGCLTAYPLLDCVADMQVVYLMDTNNDGQVDWCPEGVGGCVSCGGSTTTANPTASPTSDISCLTAAEIRQQVKEVRVYILAQEGQRDVNYDFSLGGTRTSLNATIIDPNSPTLSTTVNMVNLQDLLCPSGAASCNQEYKYYRWKLYTLVVQPNSMN